MKIIKKICLILLLACNAQAFTNQFDTMVVFGDSLSDNGNLYRYFFHIIPVTPPYYAGHFSNGPLWIEYLYDSYFPETYRIGLQDYAVGGAGAVLSRKENLPFTLTAELNDYLYWNTYGRKETSLFVIWIGANNYINGPSNVDELTNGVVANIGNVTEKLISAGGNKFLLANLADLARLPQAKESAKPALLTQLTLTHNRKLAEKIDELKRKYPEVVFVYLDAYTLFSEVFDSPEPYGFDNTSDACYLGSYSGWLLAMHADDESVYTNLKQQSPQLSEQQWQIIRTNPQLRAAAEASYWYHLFPAYQKKETLPCETYLFWDKVHPTTAVHKLIAATVKQKIEEAGLEAVIPDNIYLKYLTRQQTRRFNNKLKYTRFD